MNKTLFINNMKSNWGIFAFVAGMLLIYVTTSLSMFDPESAAAMVAMFEMLPEGMMKAFGFDGLGTELTGYLGSYLYGFILLIFPMIYTIVLAIRLVVKHVDSGSMAYLLTTPNSRIKIITTQAMYMVTSLFVLLGFVVVVLIMVSEALFPGLLDMKSFIGLNIITYLLLVVVGGITFLCSCIFNDTKNALAIGGGIPIIFFMIKMVSEISDQLEFLKYFSIYSVINPTKILSNGNYTMVVSFILVAVAALLYGSGIYIFNKRSLVI